MKTLYSFILCIAVLASIGVGLSTCGNVSAASSANNSIIATECWEYKVIEWYDADRLESQFNYLQRKVFYVKEKFYFCSMILM